MRNRERACDVFVNYNLIHTTMMPIFRERVCDAFELMGASFLLDAHDMGSCLFFWHKVADAVANVNVDADANTVADANTNTKQN